MALHIREDNMPCPCILWSLSGRDPADYHDKQPKKKVKK